MSESFVIDSRASIPNARGVYFIENITREQYMYIGSSNDIRARIKQHHYHLGRGTHANAGLQSDYDQGHRFEAGVLRFVDPLYTLLLAEQQRMNAMTEWGYTLYNTKDAFTGNLQKEHARSCARSRQVFLLAKYLPDILVVGSEARAEFLKTLHRY